MLSNKAQALTLTITTVPTLGEMQTSEMSMLNYVVPTLGEMQNIVEAISSGKTLCFWIPLLFNDNGIIVLVIPLNILGDKNIEELNAIGIPGTKYLHKLFIITELIQQNMAARKFRAIIVSPEQVWNDPHFKNLWDNLKSVQRLFNVTLDEAHCASDMILLHQQQLIVTGTLPKAAMETYLEARKKSDLPFVLFTEAVRISKFLVKKKCTVSISMGLPIVIHVELTVTNVIKNWSLAPGYLENTYPKAMQFYLYGTANHQVKLTNVNISKLTSGLAKGLIAVVDAKFLPEDMMQLFSSDNSPNFFQRGKSFHVSIYNAPHLPDVNGPHLLDNLGPILAMATVTLENDIYMDYANIPVNLLLLTMSGKQFPELSCLR
ncbi:hypothetical protein SERLA73DRAFT_152440 [Serpula lacrymans var. lacrymans S7.3]|uniref:Helicase ATP-binding domain-containing protein n=1 Tax=Serpula lacrymans var. lacrymans (strain S7.3) TaxID=936435 RepID=F8PUP1_SERL3|nr:hypothetical protein SERLA73DRAFT_152440 [Serpula lacrymans var. lacrymans S7.3]